MLSTDSIAITLFDLFFYSVFFACFILYKHMALCRTFISFKISQMIDISTFAL